ncbi:hypothetical protein Tco_0507711 [Tanacetum coccineum]
MEEVTWTGTIDAIASGLQDVSLLIEGTSSTDWPLYITQAISHDNPLRVATSKRILTYVLLHITDSRERETGAMVLDAVGSGFQLSFAHDYH